MKEFKVGDKVYLAICGNEQIKITCPCCFGVRKVKVILGNDEIVEVLCEACGLGFEGPRGFINEYKWISKVEPSVISEIAGSNTIYGFKIDSIYCGHSEDKRYFSDTDNIFYTEEEATRRCLERIAEYEKEVEQKLKWSKEKANKSYAWHVRSHLKSARDAERRLKWHSERAVYCRKLAKTEVKPDPLLDKYLKVEECPIK